MQASIRLFSGWTGGVEAGIGGIGELVNGDAEVGAGEDGLGWIGVVGVVGRDWREKNVDELLRKTSLVFFDLPCLLVYPLCVSGGLLISSKCG